MVGKVRKIDRPEQPAFQQHYTVGELAKQWHMSPPTVRAAAEQEEGVIRFGTPRLLPGKKRRALHLRIPEAVAERIYARLTKAS